MAKEKMYGPPLCMMCGEMCYITEVIDFGRDDEQGWAYCEKCKIDTFYEPLTDEEIEELEK